MDPSLQALLSAALSFAVVTCLLASIILICKSSRKPSVQHQTRSVAPIRPELTSFSVYDSASFDPSIHRISITDLAAATKNFSSDLIVGDGSFGLVYKATLPSGVTVAIKKLDPDAFQGFREFRAEMETLGKLRHQNIVKMLGYCCAGFDRVLIYEFIERGSLDQWLHETCPPGDESGQLGSLFPLSWATRIKVVKGVAHGLAYLHGLETPIIHRDIKSSNVLLDRDFEAHIADFGLARQIDRSYTHVSTQVAGTMGYMPPEYIAGYTTATIKADVYSFGVLMVEIATQKRPNWPVMMGGKEVGLIQWAREMVHEKREMEMLGENISKEGLEESKVKNYFKIACSCSGDNHRERPEMAQVVQLLNQVSFS